MAGVNYSICARNGGNYLVLDRSDIYSRFYGVIVYRTHDTFVLNAGSYVSEISIPPAIREKSRLSECTNDEIETLARQFKSLMSRNSPALVIPKMRELRSLETDLLRSGELLIPGLDEHTALIVASMTGGE